MVETTITNELIGARVNCDVTQPPACIHVFVIHNHLFSSSIILLIKVEPKKKNKCDQNRAGLIFSSIK
jgi:hypothetical protein